MTILLTSGRNTATHLPHRRYQTEAGRSTRTTCHPSGRLVRSGSHDPVEVEWRPFGAFGGPHHPPTCKVCQAQYELQWVLAHRLNTALRAAEPEPATGERSAVLHEPPRAAGWGDVYTWSRRLRGVIFDFQLVVMPGGHPSSVAIRRLTEHPARDGGFITPPSMELVHVIRPMRTEPVDA